MDLTWHSRPSPNALSFINLSLLFPRLLCLHISIGMEHKWGVEEEEEEEGEGRNEKHREVSERDISFFHTMCYCKIFISSVIPLPPSNPFVFLLHHLSVCTGWGSPGRIESTGSRLYLGSIPPNRFPKLRAVQSAAVVTRELSVVVLSRQSALKMSMFDFWVWFCDWTKGTILFIKSNLDRDLLTSCEISRRAWIDCKATWQEHNLLTGLSFAIQWNVDLCQAVINRLFNKQGKWGKNRFPFLISVSFFFFSLPISNLWPLLPLQ